MFKHLQIILFGLLCFSYSQSQAQCSVTSQPVMYCGYDDIINTFTLNSITSTGNGNNCGSTGYQFYTTPNWLLVPGQTYNWSATVGAGSWSEGFGLWIDFNGNGQYEASEGVVSSSTSTTHSGTITIPSTASGVLHMRTRCSYGYTFSTSEACTDNHGYGWGETEDYEVTICVAPKISMQPVDTFACENGSTQFSITSGTAGGFQWQGDLGTGWANLSAGSNYAGVTTNKLTINNANTNMNLARYRCIAIASCSNAVRDTSESAQLHLLPNTEIESYTKSDTSCIGLQTRLYVANKGAIITHRWQIFDNASNTYVDVPSAPFVNMGDTLLINNVPDTLNGAQIRCIVIGTCGDDTTASIPLVVNALPEVITDPADETRNQGETVSFNVVAAGVGISYQWQVGYDNVFSFINDGGIYNGVKTNMLTITGVSRVQNEFQFRCIIKGSGSCAVEPDTSNFGLLFVNPPASVGNVSADHKVTVYPNPASGNKIIVKAENGTFDAAEYRIADKLGRIVAEGQLNNSGRTEINVSQLATDIYTIHILDKNRNLAESIRFTRL